MDNSYHAAYMKRRYAERRIEAHAVLGGMCKRCGSVDELQIDHIDRTQKTMTFERMTMVGRPRWEAELAKCQLLCFPCHIEKGREFGDFRGRGRLLIDPDHGTGPKYTRDGCRCELCRRWRRAYRRGEVIYNDVPLT